MKACLGMIMYITNICNKVNSTCAFLQKNLGKCTSTIKSHMYMSDQQFSGYVPLLFGHPMLKQTCQDLKWLSVTFPILSSMTSQAMLYYSYSVSSMLTKLNWQSFEQRRTNAIIIMFYKITKLTLSNHPM